MRTVKSRKHALEIIPLALQYPCHEDFNPRTEVLSSPHCCLFLVSSCPFSASKETHLLSSPLLSDGLGRSVPATAASSLPYPHPSLPGRLHPVSLSCCSLCEQSRSESQPAKNPKLLRLSHLPPSSLVPQSRFSSHSDILSSLKSVKGYRIWSRKTWLEALARPWWSCDVEQVLETSHWG